MPEKLEEFLQKIRREGIEKAQEQAKAIESDVRIKAEEILKEANNQAREIKQAAALEVKKVEETVNTLLKQAYRNILVSLRAEIRKILENIIKVEVVQAMSPTKIADILQKIIERFIEEKGSISDLRLLLKQEDLESLKKTLLFKLRDKVMEGIQFKFSKDIKVGFIISFDKGKSFFDFTDEGFQEALGVYLKPELASLLKPE